MSRLGINPYRLKGINMEQTPEEMQSSEEQAPPAEQPDPASGTPDPNLAADGDEVKDGVEEDETSGS